MGVQVMFLAMWLLAGALIRLWLKAHLEAGKLALANICIAYFVVLGSFAHVYDILYAVNPRNFSFADDVRSSRRQEIIAAEREQIAGLQRLRTAVDQLAALLAEGHASVQVSPTDSAFVDIRTSDYRFEFMFDPSWSGIKENRRFRAARVAVQDNSGNRIGSEFLTIAGPDSSLQRRLPTKEWGSIITSYFPPRRPEQYQEMLMPLQERLQSSLRALTTEASQPLDTPRPQEWGFIDFFYFSTITQTTVGYGDILPNSSIVRCVVICQVLIALVLIGFAISWVSSGGGSHQTSSFVAQP